MPHPAAAKQCTASTAVLAIVAATLLLVGAHAAAPPACAKYATTKAATTCTRVWLTVNPKWDKAAFAALNPGVACPNLKRGVQICVAAAAPVRAVSVAIGNTHTCAVLEDPATGARGVKCFGDNRYGQLGQGDRDPRVSLPQLGDALKAVDLGPGLNVSALAAGMYFTCALLVGKEGSAVKCWGDLNGYRPIGGSYPGQMGAALQPVSLGPSMVPSAIGVGDFHACAVLQPGGLVKCWGSNPVGELGQGDTRYRFPDDASAMGAGLPPVELGHVGGGALPGPRVPLEAVAVVAGSRHTCALLQPGGVVKCWGINNFGQLGQGDTRNRGDGPDEMGNALEPVPLGTGLSAVALSAGSSHTCALLQPGGVVKCWGDNWYGQLGQGDMQPHGDLPGQMGDALKPVDLGPGLTAVAVSAGDEFTCALLQPDGIVKCWGVGYNGRLGSGDRSIRGFRADQMGAALKPVELGRGLNATGLAAGREHACAVLQPGGLLKCWGSNSWGELGQGDQSDRGDEEGEMGDALKPVPLGRLAAAA
ncbi:hypothetical protein GPECTOR_27g710 [Gonium pectorale]|uniref:LysM domain-containing protein n=1 Tax=Gonium pectorale TaxID=33097 RepID=A0A150GFA3_GONPE|nr:hypothetical protein GPECTOR_27g710 [Gonium pectorale]|eukprot:KXZ48539.1 hypothetical protein GPECTOR_27g710 [Gonium pectorale]